ncbi:sensor histidine kinase [Paenibacillus segetis]|uniref:histidine kinase n=1 Tax=Paenibacillus segetis TaxID=1325360 RepID=A0ABQ1YSR5_9BACL|nr:HAMP domain-containing sensor histidine kinase [Paenibacillus segetis]GGH35634.1 hypothetical protein GCM10008013_42030 [Paenibacillus segetis]
MKLKPRKKLRSSLLTRFILIIAAALLFIPVLIPFSLLASWGINRILYPPIPIVENRIYQSSAKLETIWHNEALALATSTPEDINKRLEELKQKYPDASLFWVDSEGTTRLQLPKQAALPTNWSIEDTIAFMKQRVNSDPLTIVAFIGDHQETKKGFMVFELPRKFLKQTVASQPSDVRIYIGLFSLMLISFILLSYLFFRDIRRRLLRLEAAMTYTGENGVPTPIQEGRPDEIGRLETAFNHMVDDLNGSRMREHEEEELRKSLISNLSHDLRTPLTVLASHLYSISKEPLSEQGQKSLSLMESKIGDLDGLIDHLLSYNLLSSGRYALSLKRQDILRIVRESAAAWYPVWEKSGIEADIELPDDEPLHWNVDEPGLRRVLDNLFQNLVRHASTGGYVGISVKKWQGRTALVISDHGPGMGSSSPAKGAGLGLPIVDLLLREMGLVRDTESSSEGTSIYIYPVEF